MPGDLSRQPLGDVVRLTPGKLKDELPPALAEIEKYGVGKFLGEHPGFPGRLLGMLKQAKPAALLSDVPDLADPLSSFLWEAVVFRAGRSKEMKSVLAKAERDIHCNIEASDSPFKCHFIVEKGEIRGASGLLHFKDEDFRFMGPTEVLFDLLTGDLDMGFGNLRLQTAGHPGWLKRIAPVMREISQLTAERG